MEYALFVSTVGELPPDPRQVCAKQWQELLPPAPLRAIYFGSEFCEDLLPEAAAAEQFCLRARQAGVEAVLLTPVVTPKGVARLDRLLHTLAKSACTPAVVFNDWGVLSLLMSSYPDLCRRSGRLLNRGVRDPRLEEKLITSDHKSREGGGRLRLLLLKSGVTAVETDPDLEGGYLGGAVAGVQRTLHFPYGFVATGRNCLVKANGAASADDCFTKGLGIACPGLCRGSCHRVARGDSDVTLWRAGNTVFFEPSRLSAEAHLASAERVVLYARPSA